MMAPRAKTGRSSVLIWVLWSCCSAALAQVGGVTWTRVASLSDEVYRVLIDPRDTRIFYAAGGQSVLKSIDRGASWNSVYELTNYFVWSLAIDPMPQTTVFAGLGNRNVTGTVIRSVDGGATWATVLDAQFSGEFNLVAASQVSPRSLFASFDGFAAKYLAKSSDGGQTWTGSWGPTAQVVIAPSDSAVVYGVPSFVQPGSAWGLYASTDGGQTWSFVNPYVGIIAVDPKSPTTLYTNGPTGQVLKSLDGGRTWLAPGSGITGSVFNDLAVDPATPSNIFAATNEGLFRSHDSGETWIRVSEGLPGQNILSMTLDPLVPSTVYVVVEGAGLFRAVLADFGSCGASVTALCVGDRFRLEVLWEPADRGIRAATAAPITSNTGAFWFFDPTNLELVVKVLDGRSINGKFWVFYGSLTNVEFTLTVTDTVTGSVKTYFNPQGQLASVADTSAF